MGRGRQKAKQTKVARRLKYFSPETDYSALQRELSGSDRPSSSAPVADDDLYDESGDDYEDYEDDEFGDDDEQDDDWHPASRRG